MSALEELLYQRLTSDTTLTGLLTQFNGMPAVFNYHAPSDTDAGWTGAKYPRADYTVDRREDPERRVVGMLMFNVWNETDSSISIEDAGARIRDLLDGAMFHPSDEPVIGLRWSQVQFFTAGRQQVGMSTSELQPTDLILGMSIEFDLFAFPAQTTFSPDPIAALNTWAEAAFTGLQVDPATWVPTDGSPALFWRFESVQLAQMTNAVSWMDATVYGHIMAPQPQDRLPWVRRVAERLVTDHVVPLDDGSYLFVQKVSADTKQDQLRTGQIKLVARYGVLVPRTSAPTITTATVSGAVQGKVT